MSDFSELGPGCDVIPRHHATNPRRRYWHSAGICMSVGISMLALAMGTPTRAIGGQSDEGGPTPAEEATAAPHQLARVAAVVVPSVFNVEAAATTRFEISASERPEDLPLGTV